MKSQIFMIKIPKVDPRHICLAVINLDSSLKKGDNYCLQVFLKECKSTEKKYLDISVII